MDKEPRARKGKPPAIETNAWSIPIHSELKADREGSPPAHPSPTVWVKPPTREPTSSPQVIYPAAPRYPEHPPEVKQSIRQLLTRWGVEGADRLVQDYPLENILDAVHSVHKMVAEGVQVTNAGGLIMWRLKQS